MFDKLIGSDRKVDVYVDLDPEANDLNSAPNNSFTKDTLTKMKYGDFLEKSASDLTSMNIVLRDESEETSRALLQEITQP